MTFELESSEHQPDDGELGKWNQWFHVKFKQRLAWHRQRLSQGQTLLIVRMDSRLISYQGGQTQSYIINSSFYHQLKALSHLPLACYLSALYPDNQQEWQELEQSLLELPETEVQTVEGLETVLRQCRLLLKHCQSRQVAAHQDIQHFVQGLRSTLAESLARAAEDEVAQLAPLLDEIADNSGAKSADIYMVVMGGHQPRYRELSKLLFRKWFTEQNDHLLNVHHHVHFCEAGESLDVALDLVASVLASQELSEAFLQSAVGLNQDVLGQFAQKAIDRHWKQRR